MFQKVCISLLSVMCVMLVLSALFNIPRTNNFFNDYQADFAVVQDVADGARAVGSWIVKAYNAVFGKQSVASALRNLPTEIDARWLYTGQPSKFFADNLPIVSPLHASNDDINAMFDTAYALLCEYMSEADASSAMQEFGYRCFFFFDRNGGVYPSFCNLPVGDASGFTWHYLDNLDESSGIASFLNDSADWIDRKLTVGITSDLYDIRSGRYWQERTILNQPELISAGYASSGTPYNDAPIVALPFSREVWLACTSSTPYAWHLAGGAQISFAVGGT